MKKVDSSVPAWTQEIATLYESGAYNQFILHGNLNDSFLVSDPGGQKLGDIYSLINRQLLSGFDVVLTYDLGRGILAEKGREAFSQWPSHDAENLQTRKPRDAVVTLTHYFRYVANLRNISGSSKAPKVAALIKGAEWMAPAVQSGLNYELNATALMMKEWSQDPLLLSHHLATFLFSENMNDLHPLLANNPRAARVKVDLPDAAQWKRFFSFAAASFKETLPETDGTSWQGSDQFLGASCHAVWQLLQRRAYEKEPLKISDAVSLKKSLVEKECQGLIEFTESDRTLDDIAGQEAIKNLLRQDIALLHQGDTKALPMGYLLCGPVGTGKTYFVECLAGEAGIPVVTIKNFRDKWVGSSEGNLEKIFRLLHALERCFVFIDEADQSLGKRDSGSSDSGLSGRIYSMFAKEMSQVRNRGKIIWLLASSRPDLIEVDLKRPGRVDVKIPLLPAHTPAGVAGLLYALCRKQGIELSEAQILEHQEILPEWLTPGSAEALAVKLYRNIKADGLNPLEALSSALNGYQNPVPRDVMEFQIDLAVRESSDMSFVPEAFQKPQSQSV